MLSVRGGLGLLAGIACLLAACRPSPKPRTEPLVHSAYVWKQGWDERAERGLAPDVIPASITELNVLVGECGLAGGARSVRVPWAAVSASGRKIALSVRVGSRRTEKTTPLDNLDQGLDLARRGLEAAKGAGIEVREVQVDFDCPTRLLADYARWVRAAKVGLGGIRLTVTALPTWLQSPDFEQLVTTADGWTLQVHGTMPGRLKDPSPLIDGDQAAGWIRQANRLGRPYRVALPTYSYLACFNANGRHLGMRAEGSGLPQGTAQCLPLPAEPAEVAKVLKCLQDEANQLVQAVDWYRLPLPGDMQVWTAKGLGAVIEGKPMDGTPKVEVRRQGALADILLSNPTEQPLALPSLDLRWSGATLVAADTTLNWTARSQPGGVIFERHPAAGFLPPGGQVVVGWVRLSEAGADIAVTLQR